MRITLKDLLWVAASGGLTAAAFPRLELSVLAWVSLIPLFFVLSRHTPGQSFFLSFLAGSVFYGILLHWIPSVPAHYGNLSPTTSFLIYLVLVAGLGLFWGLFGLVFARIGVRYRELAFVLAPLIWVGVEYLLTFVLTGFPWGLLGYTQYRNLPFIQTASLSGVFGLSFLIVLLQSLFVLSMLLKKRKPFFVGLGAVLLAHAVGLFLIHKVPASADSFRAGIVQGNVPPDIDWREADPGQAADLFRQHLALSREAVRQGAGLIVWPELSVPLCFSCPEPTADKFESGLIRFAAANRVTLLAGSIETDGAEDQPRYYNSAVSLSPDGSLSTYAKMHLVPFGEYVPYPGFFSWVRRMTGAIGQVTPGRGLNLHPFGELAYGSPICYEIVFPDLVRKFVKNGARFLVNITNDGWYGRSWAPSQHFAIAVLRAVENRRFLVRAATTGLSGLVDPYGRILARSRIMTQDVLVGTVTPRVGLTFYARHGDWLPQAGLTLSFILFMLALLTRPHDRQKHDGSRPIF